MANKHTLYDYHRGRLQLRSIKARYPCGMVIIGVLLGVGIYAMLYLYGVV